MVPPRLPEVLVTGLCDLVRAFSVTDSAKDHDWAALSIGVVIVRLRTVGTLNRVVATQQQFAGNQNVPG
jgi:hypothetical protein